MSGGRIEPVRNAYKLVPGAGATVKFSLTVWAVGDRQFQRMEGEE
jgi:hypothetical protein